MSFKNNETTTQNTEANKGLFSLPPMLNSLIPMIPLLLEQATGQKLTPMTGTMADILAILQRLETKLDTLEKNCAEQFISQESQINSLLTNTQPINDLLTNREIKFIKN